MKGSGQVVLAALLMLLLAIGSAEARRYASMVIDARTGVVLHSDKPDRWVYPASLTKVMTLYMVFEALEDGRLTLDTPLRVSRRAAGQPPSKIGVAAGRTIRVEDAILALVTKSANDVAVVIAEALGGSERAFARQMTDRARSLGLRATTFKNASGLPNSQQRTTARDMIRLGLALQRDFPKHYALFATKRFSYRGTRYRNHNRLLETYGGTDGIKTGYIRASGFNLLASVERDGRRLVAVVFGGRTSKSRNAHMVELLDTAFRRAERDGLLWAVGPSPRRPWAVAPTTVAVAAPPPARPFTLAHAPKRRPSTTALAELAPEGSADDTPLRVRIIASADAASIVERPVYGIQVGAFASVTDAEEAALAVTAIAPPVMAGAAVEVDTVDGGGDATLYRARRMGLSPEAASAVCDALTRLGQSCEVVRRQGLDTAVIDRGSS